MENIKFLDRKKELELIKKIKKNNFFLVVKGRRRIGKTTLLRKALPQAIYIFIWPNKSVNWIIEQLSAEYHLPTFKKFTDIIVYLLDQKKTIIIDEFQNLLHIDKSIYGELQKIIDERKHHQKFTQIATAGSSRALIDKVFNDAASPLYGRRTAEITLTHLPLTDLYQALKRPLSEFIKLWAVFEGAPYYYKLIDPATPAEETIKQLIISKEALLQEEGKAILSIEFGKESKTYNTILSAIAEGKTKLNEISSLYNNKTNEVNKYLDLLRKDFKLVKRTTPILADPKKSKEGRYQIIDNFLTSWFYFVDRQRNYKEQGRYKEIEKIFEKNFNHFLGKKFEKFIKQLIQEKNIYPDYAKIGRQWGKIAGAEKGKNQYEIDIVAINDDTKEILFAECKWKDKVDAEKVLAELKEKAKHVPWHNEERKEHYAIFAKSFKTKTKNCYDLKDIEKAMKKNT